VSYNQVPAASVELPESSRQFLLEEYKVLKEEISLLLQEIRKLEMAGAIAVAAILSWFASQSMQPGPAWYIPALIPPLAGLRSWALYLRVRQLSKYISSIESVSLKGYGGPSGWESSDKRVTAGILASAVIFWLALHVAALAAPSLLTKVPVPLKAGGKYAISVLATKGGLEDQALSAIPVKHVSQNLCRRNCQTKQLGTSTPSLLSLSPSDLFLGAAPEVSSPS
jgi:hypothetical protein